MLQATESPKGSELLSNKLLGQADKHQTIKIFPADQTYDAMVTELERYQSTLMVVQKSQTSQYPASFP